MLGRKRQMTNETKVFVSLDEVLSLRYECKLCGTSVTIPRQKWGDKIQRHCPHCLSEPPAEWITTNSHEQNALLDFQRSIKELIASKAMNCQISLEIKTDENKK
jgi:hypothetical protein